MDVKIYLECHNCKHNWEYKGKSKFYATCPRCRFKVNITNSKINNLEYEKK